MVKGSSRQVIVVKSPEQTNFEQVIFFVKEGTVPQASVVAQAQQIARDYGKKDSLFASSLGIPGLLWVALGASGASFCWGIGLLAFGVL